MDTLKTAVVVVLLLAVLYGVYVVLNKPEQYPHELAWETGAADPALQIELGMPEASDASSATADASLPLATWGSPSATYDQAGSSSSNHLSEDANTIEQDLAGRNDFGHQHSLPIPEPTTPAAPAIAAPDLLGATDSPTANSTAETATDVSFVPDSAQETPSLYASANEFRTPASDANNIDSTADRSSVANRYSDYGPLRDETAPANSAQANVNDIAESATAGTDTNTFQAAMQSIHTKIEAEAWKDALHKLSSYYGDPDLSPEEASQLMDLLDPLAGKVIYSMEHLVEPAYQSQPGDTLKNIAARYEVPWQLLANINGIENPETLLAGRALKVVRGPFRAEVSLSKNELTLFVDKFYAGRFAITVGNDPAPLPGQYQINDKQAGRTYYAGNGQTIPIDDPNNPYGRVWLDLGNNLSIHGSSPNGASPGQGCIALTARDAGDVFGILSKGSSIIIVR